jgi:hypothetical protein
MKYTTQRNHRNAALSAIESLYAVAKSHGLRCHELHEASQSILADHAALPRYEKAYLQGVIDEKWKDLYRNSLIFGGFYAGQFMTTHSNHDRYYQKHGIEPSDWAEKVYSKMVSVGHYWTTTSGYKPFSEGV